MSTELAEKPAEEMLVERPTEQWADEALVWHIEHEPEWFKRYAPDVRDIAIRGGRARVVYAYNEQMEALGESGQIIGYEEKFAALKNAIARDFGGLKAETAQMSLNIFNTRTDTGKLYRELFYDSDIDSYFWRLMPAKIRVMGAIGLIGSVVAAKNIEETDGYIEKARRNVTTALVHAIASLPAEKVEVPEKQHRPLFGGLYTVFSRQELLDACAFLPYLAYLSETRDYAVEVLDRFLDERAETDDMETITRLFFAFNFSKVDYEGLAGDINAKS